MGAVPLDQRKIFEALDVAISNAQEILDMSFAANDVTELHHALVDRFGVTLDEADVIGSLNFNRMTKTQRQFFADALAAPTEPPEA